MASRGEFCARAYLASNIKAILVSESKAHAFMAA
jgi:hypothetical protein